MITLQPSEWVTLSNNNLTASLSALNSVRATEGKTVGKWYWEVYIESATSTGLSLGIDDGTEVLNYHGTPSGNNKIRLYAGSAEKAGPARMNYGKRYQSNDTIGVKLDLDNDIIGFYLNGEYQGDCFNDLSNMKKPVFPRIGAWSSGDVKKATINFGHSPFIYAIPDGFSPYSKINLILLKSNNKIYSIKSNEVLHETKMTSDTTPSPYVVSASSTYSANYPAWKAFNGINDADNSWSTKNTKEGWIQIDFGSSRKVNQLLLRDRNHGVNFIDMPLSFELLGSDDGVDFDKVQLFNTSNDWKVNEERIFKLDKTVSYRFYRINILASGGKQVYTCIGEILFSCVESLIQLPSDSLDNFVRYGSSSTEDFEQIHTNKNYILQDTVSENADGLWVQEIDRKPLSIKFE